MLDPQINTTDPRFGGWWKSSRSGPNESCIYVSANAGDVAIADGKAGPDSPIIVVDRVVFAAFVAATRAGTLA